MEGFFITFSFFLLRYVEIAFAFRTFDFRREAARESPSPVASHTGNASSHSDALHKDTERHQAQFMTDADEDRQRQQQGQRQTRQDRTYSTTEALPTNLWLPYSDRVDWFSNRNFHRDCTSSTHIANNSTLHSQYASGPVVDFSPPPPSPLPSLTQDSVHFCWRCVWEEERRSGEVGREKTKGKVVSGVSGVCVCVVYVLLCFVCVEEPTHGAAHKLSTQPRVDHAWLR